MAFLPQYLLNAWQLRQGAERRAKIDDELKGWTASSLAEFHMKYQLDKHYEVSHANGSPSLSSIAVGKLLGILQTSEDPLTDVKTVAEGLSSTTLGQVLKDSRMPYQKLRVFDTLNQTKTGHKQRLVDIDEVVIRNEHYIRSRGPQNRDGQYLVSLEDLCRIVKASSDEGKTEGNKQRPHNNPLEFTRKDPPKGGLEVLDYWRPRQLCMNSSNATFKQNFDRITHNILDGLDWSNVMVAGGMALMTLLHTDPEKDNKRSIRDPDIDIYIYGLGPEDANRKAEEIHDTWDRNLPSSAVDRLVVKNAKTINLLTSYPNRRIQIVLKLLPSPTDVLLNFDLDACAIGFDGSHVFMLPRCARAIETGYSVFTMDLVWGHHLGDRRASQDSRMFKYAGRGFGIRFLPSYVWVLEKENIESAALKDPHVSKSAEEDDGSHQDNHEHRWSQRDRKPNGSEPGLKTLKRIAHLGQDYVHRFYFGATPLVLSPQQMQRQLGSGCLATSNAGVISEDDWQDLYERAKTENQYMKNSKRAIRGNYTSPMMSLADLDTRDLHTGLPDGRRGLGNFEIFIRHCEAWLMHVRADAKLDMGSTTSMVYDPDTYDDMPTYEWNEAFHIDTFKSTIDRYNSRLWDGVKAAICGKLRIPTRLNGFQDYSTRRIRRIVYGPDLNAVQEKQITIPIVIPWGLENHLLATIPREYDDIPPHFLEFGPLIPIHDPSKHDPARTTLPSLGDTASEAGNLRYWVITNESMWASQHRVLDEIAETLWSLFHCFNQTMASTANNTVNTDRTECCWRLARSFRRRIVLPEVSGHDASNLDINYGSLSLREAMLFRAWAFISPAKPNRDFTGDDGRHELFHEEAVLYPFPDELFWDRSDERTWAEGGVPEWTKVPAHQGTIGQQEWHIDPLEGESNLGLDYYTGKDSNSMFRIPWM